MPVRQFDERVGLTQASADALADARDVHLIGHSLLEVARSRVYGILAGCEDLDDHGSLGTGAASSWSRVAYQTLANWPGSSAFSPTTVPMKREDLGDVGFARSGPPHRM